jgi:hypothetical protein
VSVANAVIISEVSTSSVLELKVYAHRTFLPDDYIGEMKETIGILAGAEGGGMPTSLPLSVEFLLIRPYQL